MPCRLAWILHYAGIMPIQIETIHVQTIHVQTIRVQTIRVQTIRVQTIRTLINQRSSTAPVVNCKFLKYIK